MSYELLKSLHIISMVVWFAGVFYLPRLFVYHSQITGNGSTTDEKGHERFIIMEKRLSIMTMIGMTFTLIFGLWLMGAFKIMGMWLMIKLLFVFALIGYQVWCGKVKKSFKNMTNIKTEKYYRVMNEVPVIMLVAIVILAVMKPF